MLLLLPVVVVVDGGNKGLELGGVFGLLSKVDDIDCDVVLFELLGQLDQGLFVLFHGAADEYDNPLTLILILTVLEGQLSNLDTGRKRDLASDGHVMKCG